MWRGDVPTQRNPMELVIIKGASKRTSKPRSLTVEEFQRFIVHLGEPFHTIALVCVCFGLRISEALALKWGDVDWLNGKLSVERGIVRQHLDDMKTETSQKAITISQTIVFGGSVCESNTPATSKMPPAGFEDRDDHRTACASVVRLERNTNYFGCATTRR